MFPPSKWLSSINSVGLNYRQKIWTYWIFGIGANKSSFTSTKERKKYFWLILFITWNFLQFLFQYSKSKNIFVFSFFMSERVRLWRCRTLISKSPRIVIKYPWQSLLQSAVPRIHICSSQTEAGPPPEMRSARRRWRLFSWKTFSA